MFIKAFCKYLQMLCYRGIIICDFAKTVCGWANWQNIGDELEKVHTVLGTIHGWSVAMECFLEHLE